MIENMAKKLRNSAEQPSERGDGVGIVSENESGRVGDMASAALNVLETLLEGDGDESSHGIQADVTRSGTVLPPLLKLMLGKNHSEALCHSAWRVGAALVKGLP